MPLVIQPSPPTNFLNTFCGHFLWTIYVNVFSGCVFINTFFRPFLWTLFVDTFMDIFCDCFGDTLLWTLFVNTIYILFSSLWTPLNKNFNPSISVRLGIGATIQMSREIQCLPYAMSPLQKPEGLLRCSLHEYDS